MELWPQPSPLTTQISRSCCSGIRVSKGIALRTHTVNTKMPLKEHGWHFSLQYFTWILLLNALKVTSMRFLKSSQSAWSKLKWERHFFFCNFSYIVFWREYLQAVFRRRHFLMEQTWSFNICFLIHFLSSISFSCLISSWSKKQCTFPSLRLKLISWKFLLQEYFSILIRKSSLFLFGFRPLKHYLA